MSRLALVPLLLLVGCAAPEPRPAAGTPSLAASQVDALRAALPGHYSDFSHQHNAGMGGPVTDVTIRHLTANREAAFLVSRKLREGEVYQHQLYLLSEGAGADVLEMRFAPLGEALLKQPVPQILEAAAARFRPGCEMAIALTPEGLVGQTSPRTCRFNHPEAGDVGLLRELSFGRGKLAIAERLLDGAGNPVGEDGILRLQKHRRFDGWAGQHVDAEAAVDDPAAWRLAASFNMADDGRIEPLLDTAGDALDFGLQLARINWRADQPEILRLAMVRLSTSKIEAYAWSEPDSGSIGINLDWFQAGLELVGD
jgi:hypothetical protein